MSQNYITPSYNPRNQDIPRFGKDGFITLEWKQSVAECFGISLADVDKLLVNSKNNIPYEKQVDWYKYISYKANKRS